MSLSFIKSKFKAAMLVGIFCLPLLAVAPASASRVAPPGGSGGNAGNSCTTASASNFFQFPTWYEYLPSVTEANGQCSPKISKLSDIWLIVAAVIDILLRIGSIAAVFMIIYGGVKYTTSMGSPESTVKARSIIIDAFIGLLISIMASFFVTFIAGSFK